MKKLLVAATTALLLTGAGAAFADPPTAANIGEHPALYGLCTAYGAGQGGENGNKNSAPPFAALAEAADDGDPSTSNDIEEFCADVRPSNGQGGGSGNSGAPDAGDGRGRS